MNRMGMSIAVQRSTARRKYFVPVLSAEAELAERFVGSVLGSPNDGEGILDLGDYQIFMEAVPRAAAVLPGAAVKLGQADGCVLLVQHLDVASMDDARALLDQVNVAPSSPLGVFIYRAEADRRFKISCPECGQKLQVMEREIGMRGRCVNCKRPMKVPTPSEHVRRILRLPDAVPVLNVVHGSASLCCGALENLLARRGAGLHPPAGLPPQDFLKQATVPIQIEVSMV